MSYFEAALLIILFAYSLFVLSSKKAAKQKKIQNNNNNIVEGNSNSLSRYYGYYSLTYSLLSSVILFGIIIYLLPIVKINISEQISNNFYLFLALLIVSGCFSYFKIKPKLQAREKFESMLKIIFMLASSVAIAITLLIFFSVFYESVRFFERSSFIDFFFSLEWSPQTAMRSDQAGSSGKFGIIPVFAGTLLITFIALAIATPIGLLSAIYLSQYSTKKFRNRVKPVLEILAGIPTVVYGYFAAVTIGPFISSFFRGYGYDVASESALAAGFVMGIMIIPFIMSLSDDVMNAVPKALADASLGLGATKSETIKKVIVPAALPGIMSAFLLAFSRAIGETMIVTMAAGLIAKLTLNPFESVTTVTAQIVKLLVGDQEFDSAKTLAAFALSLTLFIITLILNVIALSIVKKYREKYE